MNHFWKIVFAGLLIANCVGLKAETVSIVIASNAAPRVQFGAEKLVEAFKAAKLDAAIARSVDTPGQKILVNRQPNRDAGREGFSFALGGNGDVWISSADDSGTLYGCLELAKRIRDAGKLPTAVIVQIHHKPAVKFLGT